MAKFEMNTQEIGEALHELQEQYWSLCRVTIRFTIERVQFLIRGGEAAASVSQSMKQLRDATKKQRDNVYRMMAALENIKNQVEQTEHTLSFERREIDSGDSAYGKAGDYGGDQGSAYKHWRQYAAYVRKYHPNYSDRKVREFLESMNEEGCGYVAMVNTVYEAYRGREDEFEETFGFPMRGEDGELNRNELLVDFYCKEDNHNEVQTLWGKKDVVNILEDIGGSGTTVDSRKYRFETYLRGKGVNVDVQNNIDVTPENYQELSQKGSLIIATYPVKITDANGKVHFAKAGHAMTITGITNDGKWIVSSWGDKYYLDPTDSVFGRIQYQLVTYDN